MAFKTDTIKLKLYTGSDPSGDNGELAIVDNTLRLKTSGAWGDVTGSSVSQLSDLSDVDDPSSSTVNEVAYLYDDGLGNLKLGFQKLTVDNLSSTEFLSVSDLADTNTPSPLTVTEENKVLGVVSYPSALSSLTFDFSGLPNPIVVTTTDQVINFTIDSQNFSMYLNPDMGGNTSSTEFALFNIADPPGSPLYADFLAGGVSPATLQNDVFIVLDNYFTPAGWTVSVGTNSITISAPSIDAQYDVIGLSGPDTLNVSTSIVLATAGGYQYELVDPIQGVLVDGDFGSAGLMTTDGAGTYTITTNNSANWDTAYTEVNTKSGDWDATTSLVNVNYGNWNTAYVWGDHSSVGYVKNFTDVQSNLSSNIIISAAERNQKHIVMGDPTGFKYVLPVPAIAMNDNTIIEIINHSSYNHTLSTMNFYDMYLTNTQTQSTADITIEKGQRALILPKPADNKYFVSILIA